MTHRFTRGDYFEVYNDPRIDGMVIIEAGNIGYDGYRVAEKDTDTDTWRTYWTKAAHVHDESDMDGLQHSASLDSDTLQAIEAKLPSEPAKSPNPVPEMTVGDVMTDFTDYSNLPTERDGSVDETRLEEMDDVSFELPDDE